MELIRKLLDKYTRNAVVWDIVILVVVWLISKYYPIIYIKLENLENQLQVLTNLIGTDISLAGFLLAALTIIVTFKSNLKAKGINESENALELIFSSKHYSSIINVFKISIVELVVCSIVLFTIQNSSENFSAWTIYRINVSGIIVTALTIFRTLFILYIILGLDRYSKDMD